MHTSDLVIPSSHPPDDPASALPAAFVCLPATMALAEQIEGTSEARLITSGEAREMWGRRDLVLVNAPLIRTRLFSGRGFREARHYDLLELFAFVRPAQFCAPSAAGLALAVGLAEPDGACAQALTLREVARRLLTELRDAPLPFRLMARASCALMQEHGWVWAQAVMAAITHSPIPPDYVSPSALHVWTLLEEWEDEAPRGAARSVAVSETEVRDHLSHDLSRAGLDERRPEQVEFAIRARGIYEPKFMLNQPNMWLLEAGTGVGKTLGYLAPSAAWLEKSGGQVWVSTYTRALQKQIYKDTRALYDTDAERQRRVVVRKGRENYLCLLNYQERVTGLTQGGPEMIIAALLARWVVYSRDGDIMGGDFPGWLPQLIPPSAMAHMLQSLSPSNLIDRRGECIHSACAHYRACFIEKAVRRSRHADIVIANHALVMAQAAYEYDESHAEPTADEDATADAPLLSRLIFDEGHHLFEAADAAFSTQLSGFETFELRRWLRGNEGRARRSRGLQARLGDLIAGNEPAKAALDDLMRAAHVLPQDGWSQRLSTRTQSGELMAPLGPIEALLAAALKQIEVRTSEAAPRGRTRPEAGEGAEVEAHPCLEIVGDAAKAAASALRGIEAPLLALVRALEDMLGDTDLDPSARVRIDGALRGLQRRARMLLPAWRSLLQQLALEDADISYGAGKPAFVDWFQTVMIGSRLVDVSLNRHFVDPSIPLAELVLKPAHGVLVASATLSDQSVTLADDQASDAVAEKPDDRFRLALQRTGAQHLMMGAQTARIASPFDYERQSRLYVVSDVPREDVRAVAHAMKQLFLASNGGGLGLFTAIRRLKAVYEQLSTPLGEAGISLYAQHVDPLDVSDLISIFRSEHHSCLLGTDAVRDGIDVPGQALRLIAFDRVPWPRPDALHKARRAHFGARSYDDALVRARLAQAFGRLIRKSDDKGVFVMLDSATPTRLFGSLPQGVVVQRCTLEEALAGVRGFLSPNP